MNLSSCPNWFLLPHSKAAFPQPLGAGIVSFMVLWALLLVQPVSASARELLVSAASSLTDTLSALQPEFERANPNVHLRFNWGASGSLGRQIEAGAPVDVFVSAASQPMERLQTLNLLRDSSRQDLVANELVLITPRGAPPLSGFSALPQLQRIAIGNPDYVPAGHYARQVLDALQLLPALQPRLIYGQNVRQVLTYVMRGEVDAGLVFATDAALFPEQVQVVAPAPAHTHEPIRYQIAVIASSREPQLAGRLVQFMRGSLGRSYFERFGFRPLPDSSP